MAEMKIGVKNRDMEVNRDDENVKAMQDFTSPNVLYKELISSVLKYHPSTDISMIEKAYKIAYAAHKGQLRKSGEPYIIHPLCVAIILADLELDKETIVAGLLHDAVEDTVMTTEEIRAAVETAEANGLPVWRKIFNHLLPNVIPQLIVTMTLGLGSIILTEATLGYLGLGLPAKYATWGNMINVVSGQNGLEYLKDYPNLWVPPGICIILAVLGFNFLGDGLRDALDPKMKR